MKDVKDWVPVDTGVMKAARKAKGWSYETVARHIHVASKTYERYEKAGRVPLELVDLYAGAVGLTIERPEFETTVTVRGNGRREEALSNLDEIDRLVAVVREALVQEPPPPERQEETP